MDIVKQLREAWKTSSQNSLLISQAADENERLRHNLQVTEQTKNSYADLAAERLEEIERLRKDRDELLSVLKFVRKEVDLSKWVLNTGHTLDDLAEAAITSVKGAE